MASRPSAELRFGCYFTHLLTLGPQRLRLAATLQGHWFRMYSQGISCSYSSEAQL